MIFTNELKIQGLAFRKSITLYL